MRDVWCGTIPALEITRQSGNGHNMKQRPEHLLVFYAAIAGRDDSVTARIAELIGQVKDTACLVRKASGLGVAGNLSAKLHDAGMGASSLVRDLREAMVREMRTTASMKALNESVSSILEASDVPFIALKGSDPRIAEGAREFFNPMQDIDILVRKNDIERAAGALESAGFHYQGTFSGSHATFFTLDDTPRFVEIHWDLINRENPIHSRLFHADIDAVWKRSEKMCARSLLSPGDLLSYCIAHAVKEYFHKPKWLADIAWIIREIVPSMDSRESYGIVNEWGVSNALGIAATALSRLLPDMDCDCVYGMGAKRPGALGRYCADHLINYDILRYLRPALMTAAAPSFQGKMAVMVGIGRQALRKGGIPADLSVGSAGAGNHVMRNS